MLKNHHAFESKVQEAQEAQVVQVVQVAQVARANQVARERPEGLRVAHRTAHAAKDHAARDADLKGVLRTALQEALALKDQAEEDQAEKECGVRIPNDSSSGPWNSIVMAMASSIATS